MGSDVLESYDLSTLWMGRNWLREIEDDMRGTALLERAGVRRDSIEKSHANDLWCCTDNP